MKVGGGGDRNIARAFDVSDRSENNAREVEKSMERCDRSQGINPSLRETVWSVRQPAY